jgi:hypothetical protein
MSDLFVLASPTKEEILADGGTPTVSNEMFTAFHNLVSVKETEWNVTFGHVNNPTATQLRFGDPKQLGYMRDVRAIFNLFAGLRAGKHPFVSPEFVSHYGIRDLFKLGKKERFAYAFDDFNGRWVEGELSKELTPPSAGYFATYDLGIGGEIKMEQFLINDIKNITDRNNFWLCAFAKAAAARAFAQGYALDVFLSMGDAFNRWQTCKAVIYEEDDDKAVALSADGVIGAIVRNRTYNEVSTRTNLGIDADLDLESIVLTLRDGTTFKASEIRQGESIVCFLPGTTTKVSPYNGWVQDPTSPRFKSSLATMVGLECVRLTP